MWIAKWILGVILIIIVLGFSLQNQHEVVNIHVFNWMSPELPLYFIIYISFALGILTWLLVSIFKILQLKTDIRQFKKRSQQLQDELNKLRNLSIEDAVLTTDVKPESSE
jgi:uncharacterized integral membrane protein